LQKDSETGAGELTVMQLLSTKSLRLPLFVVVCTHLSKQVSHPSWILFFFFLKESILWINFGVDFLIASCFGPNTYREKEIKGEILVILF
jgi:hypothetical protein